jgi:hypothetical protein
MEFEVNAPKTSTAITLICLGAGTLKVAVPPLAGFDMACASNKVNRMLNQIDLKRTGKVTVSVATTPGMTWSMRIQQ